MAREEVAYQSEGLVIKGHFYTPDNAEPPYPCVVMGGGWCYVKELIQPEYAEFFTAAGYAALTFDYRHLGDSEGEPRQHINPWAQVDDLINSITYASLRDDVDADRIGVWGISYAGAHVFPVGALDQRVKVILSVVPMLDGYYNSLRANSNVGYRELLDVIAEDRVERFQTGQHGTIAHSAHPHDAPSAFPAPETWPVFKKFKKTVAPNHEHWTTIQSVEYVLAYDVTPYMKRINYTPVLMVTSASDDITMTEYEIPAFNTIPTPRKQLVQIGGGASHMSLYDNPDHLELVGNACAGFVKEYL